jgi:hypothetical protein
LHALPFVAPGVCEVVAGAKTLADQHLPAFTQVMTPLHIIAV